MNYYDVIIIGGGMGGLVCGTILSQAGKSVLVLEQGAQAGGCIQSYRRGGLMYDTGFHYVGALGEGQLLYPLFDYLGLMSLPWHQLDAEGFDHVMIGGRNFIFASGYDAFVKTLADEFPHERMALQKYADMLSTRNTDAIQQMQTSAYQYLTTLFHDSLLVNVLSGRSIGVELRRNTLPLFTFAHCQAPFIESSWRLRGDGSMIVRRLMGAITKNGGKILCSADVEKLDVRDGKVVAAQCRNGETFEGRTFISSLHPALTCDLVKTGLKDIFRHRIVTQKNTQGMFTVSLHMKPQRVPYFNYNQYIYRKPNVWTYTEDVGGVGGVMVSCRVPQKGTWTEQIDLLTPVRWTMWEEWKDSSARRRPMFYEHLKRRFADECIQLAERFIPGLSDKYDRRYISTPLTWCDYVATPDGSAYGIRKDYHQPLMTILSPRTSIPNLLLTGQSLVVHGLQGVTQTAFNTCSEILGKDYIQQILKI